jgi:hypothetical protein
MTLIECSRPADEDLPGNTFAYADLNAIVLNAEHLSTAREILAQLAIDLRWDHLARQAALRADMAAGDTVTRAIDAKLTALRKWQDIHDPARVLDENILLQAAALAPLVDTDHGIGFDDATFAEITRSVGDLPARSFEGA